MYWWQVVVFPLALLFHGITKVRNWMYDKGINRSTRHDARVVGVGNLAIGGTGKSPMTDYLIRYFGQAGWQVATLSRGYARKTSGFQMAGPRSTPAQIGDEPYMYFHKHGPAMVVAVGEDRDLAIPELLLRAPWVDVIVMDDAMQHRRVVPACNILLTTYQHPFYSDYLLPAGRLREGRSGAGRADVVIVTRCPVSLTEAEQAVMTASIQCYTNAEVFFMHTVYESPKSIFDNDLALQRQVVGISGMAVPTPFEDYLHAEFSVKLTHNYRDHYHYKDTDIRDIVRELDGQTSLVTTEKDMVKLKAFPALRDYSCYYIPIRMEFIRKEQQFLDILMQSLRSS